MAGLETTNFFRDRSVQDDPYAYFDAVRAQGPVWQEPHYGVFMVTGHEEATATVYNDSAHVLVVQRGERTLREVLRAVRGRRRHRRHRAPPRRAAVQRPAPVVRPAPPHRAPAPDDAPAHPEAPRENEEFM